VDASGSRHLSSRAGGSLAQASMLVVLACCTCLLVRSKHLFLQVSLFDTCTNIAIRTNASCSKVGKPDLGDAVSAVIQDKQFQLMTPIAGLLCNNPARAYPKNHPIAYFHAA
jgi:hypothetical protein